MNNKLINLSDNNASNLDSLPESIKNILDFVTEHYISIKKVKRDNEKLERDLWKRNINELIESWETFYMKSCIDFTLSLLEKLKNRLSEKENIFLGIEKLKRINSGIEDIHLYVEISYNNKKLIIDFPRDNMIYLYSHDYQNIRPDIVETISTSSIPSSIFDGNDSIISIANKIGEWKNIEKFLNNLDNLKRQNTNEEFQDFEKRMNNKIKLNIEWDWHEIDINNDKQTSVALFSVLSIGK